MKSHKTKGVPATILVAAALLAPSASHAQWAHPQAPLAPCNPSPVLQPGCAGPAPAAAVIGPSVGALMDAAAPAVRPAPAPPRAQKAMRLEIIQPVPEPGSYATLLAGLGVLAWMVLRQRRQGAGQEALGTGATA